MKHAGMPDSAEKAILVGVMQVSVDVSLLLFDCS